MKQKLVGDRMLQEAAMRAGLRLVHMDIEIGVEFYDQTRGHYGRKVQEQKKRYDARPESYWKQDVGYGTTRGDLASEEYQEVQELLQLQTNSHPRTGRGAFILRQHCAGRWQTKAPCTRGRRQGGRYSTRRAFPLGTGLANSGNDCL